MGEPSKYTRASITKLPNEELKSLFAHQFPGATLAQADGQFIAGTVHGVGATEREAMENALTHYHTMREDALALDQLLKDVRADLDERGMSRARHDSDQELLNLAENALNAGVLTQVIGWIMVPHYTREIEDLRRRVSMRLQMVAQELQLRDQARKRASQKFPRANPTPEGPSPDERLKAFIWKGDKDAS